MGRYSPEYGRPKACASLEVSAGALPPSERCTYWRDTLLSQFHPDPDSPTSSRPFHAHAHGLIAPRGELFVSRSDAISGRRTEKQVQEESDDAINVCLILAGCRHHEPQKGASYTGHRGDVFIYGSTQPPRISWSDHRVVYLRLTRETVEAALGGHIPAASALVRALTRSNLWPFLRAQMALLARQLPNLSRAERAILLDHTIDMAVATLQTVGPHGPQRQEGARHGLFKAAQRFIQLHLANPDLNIKAITRAVGCSRSTLYRAFAENHLTVAGYIREQRLQRLHQLLQTADKNIPVAILAERCGMWGLTNVSKAFRKRFGMSPSEARNGVPSEPPSGGRRVVPAESLRESKARSVRKE